MTLLLFPAWGVDAIPLTVATAAPQFITDMWVQQHTRIAHVCQAHLTSREQVEDAVMETYARLAGKVDVVMVHPRPQAWLMTTARYVCLEQWRRLNWDVRSLDISAAGAETGFHRPPLHGSRGNHYRLHEEQRREGASDDDEQRKAAGQWIGDLSPRLRETCELAMEGLTWSEIADQLGIKVEDVYVRLSRAVRQLQARRRRQIHEGLVDLEEDG